ncbi:NYN domain-containing protein [Candidatus Saccharibacteria bacterium]|nr:NYN domain-containing protein [Candidatus Saccharibacteria bacterium]
MRRYFENGKETTKGNVDAELVLHASAIEFPNYDQAIIVSGDGDFACLIEFLQDKNKLLHIFTPNNKYSKLLKPYSKYVVELSQLKASLEYKKTGIGGRSKP